MNRTLVCINDPNRFCYICGIYTTNKGRHDISKFIKDVYKEYFSIEIVNQDKTWVPHSVCSICYKAFSHWKNGNRKHLPFDFPMIWREPFVHNEDCYFCLTKVDGFNSKNKNKIKYPEVCSVTKPIPHKADHDSPSPSIQIESENSLPFENESIVEEGDKNDTSDDEYIPPGDVNPKPLSQGKLNDLVRDLNLPKEAAELLGSRLREEQLLAPDTTFSWHRHREEFL